MHTSPQNTLMLGPYEVLRSVGSGGMADLFLCRKRGLGGFEKHVVVKIVQETHAHDEEFLKMFLDEARITARFHHPNLPQVFEIGELNGLPYMVMEYIAGPALHRLVRRAERRKDVDARAMAWMIAGLCRGLHAAHNARGNDGEPLQIVHRDVSLQNALVTLDGVVKVIDFGVASGRERLAQTEVGLLKGKLQYMAPEQLSGAGYNHRADIFATGVCLYRATTGVMPFEASNPQELWRVRLKEAVVPPTQVDPDYPPELEAIVLRAMEPDPDKRYATAEEMAVALEAFAGSLSQKDVAMWVNDLFPNAEEWGTTGAGLPQTSDRFARFGPTSTHQLVAPTTGVHTTAVNTRWLAQGLGLTAMLLVGLSGGTIVLALALLNNTPPAVESTTDTDISGLLEDAREDIVHGNLTKASDKLEVASELKPTLVEQRIALRSLQRELRNARQVQRIDSLITAGDLPRARELAEELYEIDPSEANAALVAKLRLPVATPEEQPLIAAVAPAYVPRKPRELQPAQGSSPERPDPAAEAPLASAPPAEVVHVEPEPPQVPAESLTEEPVERTPDDVGPEDVEVAEVDVAAGRGPQAGDDGTDMRPPPHLAEDLESPDKAPLPTRNTRLRAAVDVRTPGEMTAELARVESELIRDGYPSESVQGLTRVLLSRLIDSYAPGTQNVIYPRATYRYLAEELTKGTPAGQIRRSVADKHFRSDL